MNANNHKPEKITISLPIWFLWIFVCSLIPIINTISATALNKQILRSDPNASLITFVVIILLILPVIIPFLQWLVLRRIVSLSPWRWVGAVILSLVLFFALYLQLGITGDTDRDFIIARGSLLSQYGMYNIPFSKYLTLPWDKLILQTIFMAVVFSVIPSYVLGRKAGGKWYLFLFASISGMVVANIIEQIYLINFSQFYNYEKFALNGMNFLSRIEVLSFRGGLGAVFGAVSGIVLFALFRVYNFKDDVNTQYKFFHRVFIMTLITIVIMAIPPIFTYIIGPQGIFAGFPAIRKMLSTAPDADKSEGENVITYSHDIDFAPPQYPVLNFAPDGKSFVAINNEGKIKNIDIMSGAEIGQLDKQIRVHGNYNFAWSKDGSFFALSTDGREVGIEGLPYTRHSTQYNSHVSLYSMPNYKLIGEFEYSDGECFSRRESIVFSPDNKKLWLFCNSLYTKVNPEDIFAIELDVPLLSISEIRRYGNNAENGTMDEFAVVGDDILYWSRNFTVGNIRLRSLIDDKYIELQLPDIRQKDLAGGLTSQGAVVKDSKIFMSFCGEPSEVSDPTLRTEEEEAPIVHSFCRTLVFSIETSKLLEKIDDPNKKKNIVAIKDPLNEIRIEAPWQQPHSKSCEVTVWDVATGKQKQRITTYTQRPLSFSPDGHWLFMYAPDKGKVTVYKVKRINYIL